ncbi:MAG: hypothetical protein EXR73_15055 [Myxococcales bacterium]|nr:hypothetical protein [Myxococcales bacterium]
MTLLTFCPPGPPLRDAAQERWRVAIVSEGLTTRASTSGSIAHSHLAAQRESRARGPRSRGARRPRPRSPLRLSLAEREEISRDARAGNSLRTIVARLRRSPSTVARRR